MAHRPEKYLEDMLDACEFTMEMARTRSERDLRDDRMFRAAIERELQIIGEALWQLTRVHPDTAATIPEHRRIIGLRHALVHGYDMLEPGTIWFVVTEKVPELAVTLRGLLRA